MRTAARPIAPATSTHANGSPSVTLLSMANCQSGSTRVPKSCVMWTLSSRQTPPPTVPWSKQMRVSSSRTLFAGARISAIDVPGPAADEYCLASVTTSHTSAAERRPANARRSASRVKRFPVVAGNQREAQQRVQGEFPLHEPDREDGAAPGGLCARQPDQKRVEKRLDVHAARLHEHRSGPRRRRDEEQRRDTGEHRRQAASRSSVRSSRNAMTRLTTSSGSFSAATETPNTVNDSAAIQASTARM